MAGLHDLDLHFDSALHHRVEVIHFEPEQHTIAVGSVGTIANAAVVVFDFKAVQLQNEPSILYQLLILPAPVSPSAAEQALIPPAAGFDIRDTNERLRAHGFHPNRFTRRTSTGVIVCVVKFAFGTRSRRGHAEGRLSEQLLFSWAATCISLPQRCHMDKEHVKGAADKVVGKIKEVAGHATGDRKLEAEGKVDQTKGTIHSKVGDAKDAGKDAIDSVRNAPSKH
jgi:uncharacterized protein YjbJ (UPF0337 family)